MSVSGRVPYVPLRHIESATCPLLACLIKSQQKGLLLNRRSKFMCCNVLLAVQLPHPHLHVAKTL
jgi:hypothetical protein